MTRPTEEVQESTAYAAIIDTSTKEPIDKKSLLKLLKSHRVKTTYIENSENLYRRNHSYIEES